MLKKFHKTLSIGLGGLLALGIGVGVANASGTAASRTPNVLHEMVPHVILPETIQYNKTAKNAPGIGYSGANSPYVATYVAYPSYQVPHTTTFRSVGQSVYPVSPPLLPAPLPKAQPKSDVAIEEDFVWQETDSEDIVLSSRVNEPIRLTSSAEGTAPPLPIPNGAVMQTRGLFCQQPAQPPSAWAFSSPIFKVASVPAGWGNQQAGGIVHSSPRGSVQHVGFQPSGVADPAMAGAAVQGIPYSTFQMGHGHMGHGTESNNGPQVQVLPNGMVMLTLPPSHHNCGLLRCRTGCAPRTVLLPPAGYAPPGFPTPQAPQGMMPQEMMAPAPQMAMMSGGFGTPFMQVSQQSQMMPQMQIVPVTAMTPMGPALVGYQQIPQIPMMNPMANPMAMMNPMENPLLQQLQQMQQAQQIQMAMAVPSPAIASQVLQTAAETETGEDSQTPAMAVVATPFGYAIRVPADALQGDMAAQLSQMQQALIQSQMPMQMPIQMPTNPYAGLYATPFGYLAMNQSAGQLGFGQPMMMHAGYTPMGMGMGMSMLGQGGMSVSDMLQIMTFINSNKPQQRRARLADRIAERREARRTTGHDDPFAQLMQAWTTPYVAPDTALRMPSRNAYPYGHFGVQASPVNTANYGGYHNLYFGNATYPGLY